MRKIFLLIIIYIISLNLYAQELRFNNECNFCFRAIDNKINIRLAPNTKSEILGQLNESEIIYVNKNKSSKSWLYCYVPKINNMAYVYSEYFKEAPDYNDDNGTILSDFENKIQRILIRKHKQNIYNINLKQRQTIPIKQTYDLDAKTIGYIETGDNILINKVLTKESKDKIEIWEEITFNNITGWIFISNDNSNNPYSTYDFYSILYYKDIENKKVPVRNIEVSGKISGNVNLYKEPNENSEVIIQAHMTFNKYIDDNGEEYFVPENSVWLKSHELLEINNKVWIYTSFENSWGWVNFNELSTERGGYRVYTPEIKIQTFFTSSDL